MNKCPKCDSVEIVFFPDGSLRCKYCGTIISRTNTFGSMASRGVNRLGDNLSSGTKNKLIAILLAFFLGGIGGQYFYLGKYLQGVICLLFCWTIFPAIWGVIHAIIILSISDESFHSRYNQTVSQSL